MFYNREDLWEVPLVGGERMEPYYTVMKLPGEATEEFILMLPFNPSDKPNLAAWLVARADGEAYGQMRVYKFPKDKTVYGPGQIDARINQDDAISQELSLWDQEGSSAPMGTLLVIPVEESLLYVRPLYLEADGPEVATPALPGMPAPKKARNTSAIPELKRVIVAYDDHIAMAPTLDEALAQIFAPSPPQRTDPLGEASAATDREDWRALATRAGALWAQVEAAAAEGDWTRYGEALQQLEATIGALATRAAVPAEPAHPTED